MGGSSAVHVFPTSPIFAESTSCEGQFVACQSRWKYCAFSASRLLANDHLISLIAFVPKEGDIARICDLRYAGQGLCDDGKPVLQNVGGKFVVGPEGHLVKGGPNAL